ncbi:MAG: sigma 54-dependent Fis family transcriptional regulator [Labilithrix sp.]|nr:sigma 54-dependent Fis family transcriptional regulator [Labilithrix sp.]MCW5817635.1 sigma 54-dependent Fis family transcriptional regulator [Labilithrix sp.]
MFEGTKSLQFRPRSIKLRAATLRVTKGPDTGRTVKLDQPSFVIGVGESADFRLTDPAVSREHLRFALMPAGIRVRDEGSKNGTYCGGLRVHDVLVTSDVAFSIGETMIAVTLATESIELPLSTSDRFGDAIGVSAAMRHLFAQLEKAAATDLTILIEGESGVGKDVLARAVHAKSARANEPFVVADCSAIPEQLIESELFGHERGAFTGADRARKGVVEEANGGTLFLDEIGELPLDMQPKLLRVMEQREVRPVGSSAVRPINVRFVAATNRRLTEAARTGEFRSDLFYRLAVIRASVPALRDRTDDILPIARAMLRSLKRDEDADFPEDFASMLTAYTWPGNVRELRNVVERHAMLGEGAKGLFDEAMETAKVPEMDLADLTFHEARKLVMDRFEERYLPQVLERASGNMTKAAELAGVARPSFYRMMERLRPAKKE